MKEPNPEKKSEAEKEARKRISVEFTGKEKSTQEAIESGFLSKYKSVLESEPLDETKNTESVRDLIRRQEEQLEEWEIEVNYLHMQDAQSGIKKALDIYREIVSADFEREKALRVAGETITGSDKIKLKEIVRRLNTLKRKLSSFVYNHNNPGGAAK